jgi:hypothetical protein
MRASPPTTPPTMPPIAPPDVPFLFVVIAAGPGEFVVTEVTDASVLAGMVAVPLDSEDADSDTGSDVVGVADA